MSEPSAPVPDVTRAARRLLRWYPRVWRDSYGDEFAELLAAELAEDRPGWRWRADIARSGLLARCRQAGLVRSSLPSPEQTRAGLAAVGMALAVLLALGVAMLAQLAMGWQWAAPGSSSAADATLAMGLATACLVLLGLAAAVPIGAQVVLDAATKRNGRVTRPAALAAASAAAFVGGAMHFQDFWPGTGGTGAEHALVPGGAAAFGWASTLSMTSFWVHPAMLDRLPAAELAWMLLSPLAAIAALASTAVVIRRLVLPAAVLAYLARLANAALVAAILLVAGSLSWLAGHQATDPVLFRPGLVDFAELLLMAGALAIAIQGNRAARQPHNLSG